MFGGTYGQVTFREIQNHENRTFGSVPGENRRSRCGIDARSDYQNNPISMYTLLERQLVTTLIVANLDPNHHAAIGLALALAFALPIGRDPRTG